MKRIFLAGLSMLTMGALVSAPAEGSSIALPESAICSLADVVVIGTVSGVSSAYQQTAFGNQIMSTVTISPERMIHGPNVSTLTFSAESGKVGMVSMGVGGTPLFHPGERYLLLLHSHPPGPPTLFGDGASASRLVSNITLPPLSALVAMWQVHCG